MHEVNQHYRDEDELNDLYKDAIVGDGFINSSHYLAAACRPLHRRIYGGILIGNSTQGAREP
jgi:hypothetical protein